MEEKVHKLSKKKLAYHREYYKKTHKIIKKDKLKKDLESYHRQVSYFSLKYGYDNVDEYIEQSIKFHSKPDDNKLISWFQDLIRVLVLLYEMNE